jgi:hypothetical protein
VVADHGDLGARAAAAAASSSLGGGEQVLVAAGADLAAARWRHHVTSYGEVSTSVRLPGHGELTDHDLAGVLVRPCGDLVPPGLRHSPEHERGYAAAELTALTASWLLSLGRRVVNAVEGASPWGPSWTAARWLGLAAQVGLPVASGTPDRRLVLAGRHVVGARDEDERSRALELAERSGCRLLEISFDGSSVTGASCVPLLLEEQHVAALAAALVDLARGDADAAA